MSKYHEVIYGNYVKTKFPQALIEYLLDNYWPKTTKYDSYRHFVVSSCGQKMKVLDIGCGDCTYIKEGFWPFHFKEGIDYNMRYSQTMQKGKLFETQKAVKFDLNKDNLPYKDETFDIVFTKSVIEHITDTDHFLSEIKRVLKPGGIAIILTPAWEYNWLDFYNDYTHIKPFHRKGLQDALRMQSFSKVDVGYHYHLPWLWKNKLKFPAVLFLRMFSRWKWKNKEENIHRVNIRFSQEVQLLGVATK